MKLALVSEKDDKRLTAAQRRINYDYDKEVGKHPVFETKELVLIDIL